MAQWLHIYPNQTQHLPFNARLRLDTAAESSRRQTDDRRGSIEVTYKDCEGNYDFKRLEIAYGDIRHGEAAQNVN